MYVGNKRSPAISAFRVRGARVERTVQLESTIGALAVSRDGTLLAALSAEANAIVLVDPHAGGVIAAISTQERNPRAAAFSPDARWLYVAAEDAAQVDVIDVRSLRQVERLIAAGRAPDGLAISGDGRLFVSNEDGDSVSIIDLSANRAVATVCVGRHPGDLVLTPDGARLYVVNGGSNSVSVLDTLTNKRLLDIPVGVAPEGAAIAQRLREP